MSYPYDIDVMLYETYLGVSLTSSKSGGGGDDEEDEFVDSDNINDLIDSGYAYILSNSNGINYLDPSEEFGSILRLHQFADVNIQNALKNHLVRFCWCTEDELNSSGLTTQLSAQYDEESASYRINTNAIPSVGTNYIFVVCSQKLDDTHNDWNLEFPLTGYVQNSTSGEPHIDQETGKVVSNGTLVYEPDGISEGVDRWILHFQTPVLMYTEFSYDYETGEVSGKYEQITEIMGQSSGEWDATPTKYRTLKSVNDYVDGETTGFLFCNKMVNLETQDIDIRADFYFNINIMQQFSDGGGKG